MEGALLGIVTRKGESNTGKSLTHSHHTLGTFACSSRLPVLRSEESPPARQSLVARVGAFYSAWPPTLQQAN
jgi:hypothetical protein